MITYICIYIYIPNIYMYGYIYTDIHLLCLVQHWNLLQCFLTWTLIITIEFFLIVIIVITRPWLDPKRMQNHSFGALFRCFGPFFCILLRLQGV